MNNSVIKISSLAWLLALPVTCMSCYKINIYDLIRTSENRVLELTELNHIVDGLYEEELAELLEINQEWLDGYVHKIKHVDPKNLLFINALDDLVKYCKRLQFARARQIIEKYTQNLKSMHGVQRSINALWQTYADCYADVFDAYGVPVICALDSLYEQLAESEKAALMHDRIKLKSFVLDLIMRYKIKRQLMRLLAIEDTCDKEITKMFYRWIDNGLSMANGIRLTASFSDTQEDTQWQQALYRAFYTPSGIFKLLNCDEELLKDSDWPQELAYNTQLRYELNMLLMVVVSDEQTKCAVRKAFEYLCQAAKSIDDAEFFNGYRKSAKRIRQALMQVCPRKEILVSPPTS